AFDGDEAEAGASARVSALDRRQRGALVRRGGGARCARTPSEWRAGGALLAGAPQHVLPARPAEPTQSPGRRVLGEDRFELTAIVTLETEPLGDLAQGERPRGDALQHGEDRLGRRRVAPLPGHPLSIEACDERVKRADLETDWRPPPRKW